MLPLFLDDVLEIVRSILALADLKDLPLTLVSRTQNWVFETMMPDGEKALIRLRPVAFIPSRWTGDNLDRFQRHAAFMGALSAPYVEPVTAYSSCESFMLRTLAHKTTLVVPRPLKIMGYGAAELVIFSDIPGDKRTPETITAREAAVCGAFLAQLHADSQRLIFRSETDPLLSADSLLGEIIHSRYATPPDGVQYLSSADLELLDTLRRRMIEVEAESNAQPGHTLLLHGNFLIDNIVFDGETVGALNFEMCGWGTDLYDVATFLWQMKPSLRYERIADAFWRGYTIWRELPPREHLETFIAARQGASVRWLIQNRHLPAYAPRVPALIRQRMDEIAAFLETGVLKRA